MWTFPCSNSQWGLRQLENLTQGGAWGALSGGPDNDSKNGSKAFCPSYLFYQTKFEIASLIVHWGQELSLQNRHQRENHQRMTIYLSSLHNIYFMIAFKPRTGNIVIFDTIFQCTIIFFWNILFKSENSFFCLNFRAI